jgi:hypothetical protein
MWERFASRVDAPPALVLEVATTVDLQALSLVPRIFWLREKLMRAEPRPADHRAFRRNSLALAGAFCSTSRAVSLWGDPRVSLGNRMSSFGR